MQGRGAVNSTVISSSALDADWEENAASAVAMVMGRGHARRYNLVVFVDTRATIVITSGHVLRCFTGSRLTFDIDASSPAANHDTTTKFKR